MCVRIELRKLTRDVGSSIIIRQMALNKNVASLFGGIKILNDLIYLCMLVD